MYALRAVRIISYRQHRPHNLFKSMTLDFLLQLRFVSLCEPVKGMDASFEVGLINTCYFYGDKTNFQELRANAANFRLAECVSLLIQAMPTIKKEPMVCRANFR